MELQVPSLMLCLGDAYMELLALAEGGPVTETRQEQFGGDESIAPTCLYLALVMLTDDTALLRRPICLGFVWRGGLEEALESLPTVHAGRRPQCAQQRPPGGLRRRGAEAFPGGLVRFAFGIK